MTNDEMKIRTKQFALRVIRLTTALPKSVAADVLARQLVRSASSVAANYRSACRARSHRDFIAKMGIVEEEADESGLWLEVISESGLLAESRTGSLQAEASEITAIAVASIKTARGNSSRSQRE